MITLFVYVVLGLICSTIFLLRQSCRIDAIDLFGAGLVFIAWPFYMFGVVVMRLFNGDWR